jgi:branched-chain amino acid aminotransferase
MGTRVYIDGQRFDAHEARISVFDRGFLYGDSVYEVLRTSGGRPVDLEDHLVRLARSAAAIALPPPPAATLREAVAGTLADAANPESYVRIIVTRGAGEIGLDTALAEDPCTLVIVKPLELPTKEMYERGVKLEIVGVERTSTRSMDPSVKSGNYLNNILALAAARRAGAYEALMCDAAGRVAEGSTSNVFIARAGTLVTPSLEVGILAGITRQRVIELASADGIAVSEGSVMPADVRSADEVFLTSSIRGVLPVARVDDRAVGAACPGPLTRRVMELYAGHLAKLAAARG